MGGSVISRTGMLGHLQPLGLPEKASHSSSVPSAQPDTANAFAGYTRMFGRVRGPEGRVRGKIMRSNSSPAMPGGGADDAGRCASEDRRASGDTPSKSTGTGEAPHLTNRPKVQEEAASKSENEKTGQVNQHAPEVGRPASGPGVPPGDTHLGGTGRTERVNTSQSHAETDAEAVLDNRLKALKESGVPEHEMLPVRSTIDRMRQAGSPEERLQLHADASHQLRGLEIARMRHRLEQTLASENDPARRAELQDMLKDVRGMEDAHRNSRPPSHQDKEMTPQQYEDMRAKEALASQLMASQFASFSQQILAAYEMASNIIKKGSNAAANAIG